MLDLPMVIEIEPHFESQDDVCVVRLKGRFVAGTDQSYVQAKLDEIKVGMKPRARNSVLVDVAAVSAIGSMGIGFLVGLYTSVIKNPAGRFVLTGANSRVCDVLRLMRLDTVLPQAPDLPSGLAALRS
jgi:anti-anti-sigma factor